MIKSCERAETKYNIVVHGKVWRKGAAILELYEGIACCGLIITIKAIFQLFPKFPKTISLFSSFFFSLPKISGNFASLVRTKGFSDALLPSLGNILLHKVCRKLRKSGLS